MTWFRVDDGFSDHAKVHALQDSSKHWKGALALWTLTGAWCAGHEKDGFVPAATVKRLGFVPAEADALVEVELWHAVEGGYRFHQWEERNPLKADLETKREQTRNKVTAWRGKNKKPECNLVTRESVTGYKEVSNHPVTLPPSQSQSHPIPDPPLPPPGASASAGQEVREGWAAAWFAANAGTPPVLTGQTFTAAVEFARQVAKTHGKPLHEAAKAIAAHVLKQNKTPRDIPFDLARMDPYALTAPRIETAEEHNRRANHVGESYEDYLRRKAADPWAKAVRP